MTQFEELNIKLFLERIEENVNEIDKILKASSESRAIGKDEPKERVAYVECLACGGRFECNKDAVVHICS